MMGWAKEYGNAVACDSLGNIKDIGIGLAYSFLENIVLRPTAGIKSYLTMGGFDTEAWLDSYEQAVINQSIKNLQSFYIGQLLGDAIQSILLIMNFLTLVKSLAGALMAAASVLSTGGIDMSVRANGAAMLVSAGVSEGTAEILAGALGVAGSAVVAQLVLAMGGSIIDDIDKLAQSVSNSGGKGDTNSERTIKNSAGQDVTRKYVKNQDELLQKAEDAAGGILDDWTFDGENQWVSPDKSMKIEWNPDGHANTNEGPHVTIRTKNSKGGNSVTDKYFIEGWDNYKQTYDPK